MFALVVAGAVTLVLDFGRFVLDSDAASLERLGEEAAAVYLPFQLVVRNVSAYLVDGAFDWGFMGSRLGPLLESGGVVDGGKAGAHLVPRPIWRDLLSSCNPWDYRGSHWTQQILRSSRYGMAMHAVILCYCDHL